MTAPRRMTISQARRSFAAVLSHARAGQEVEITSRGAVVARVLPADSTERVERVFGCDRGRIHVADDFDAPVEDFAAYMK